MIPKAIRDRLRLRSHERAGVQEHEGEIRVPPPKRRAKLVRTEHGLLAAGSDTELPGFGPEEVRELLERTRR